MGFRISTNVPSLSALRNLRNNSQKMEQSINKLSSGERINKAADDAAGLAISENLRADIRGLDKARLNAEGGISMTQVAEGSLNEISNNLIRLRELSVQGASDILSDNDRSFLDLEFMQLKNEIDRIAKITEFQGRKLINGENQRAEFQVGSKSEGGGDSDPNTIGFDSEINAGVDSLGVSGLSVGTLDDSRSAISNIDFAINKINSQRASLGALQNRLQSSINNLGSTIENMSAAKSSIRDADIAEEASEAAKNSLLQNAGIAVLAQANALPSRVLTLLS